MMLTNGSAGLNGCDGTDVSRIDRESVANEVGAAIAHQLNGPLTALLLYLGDLYQGSDRFPVGDCDGLSLKEVAENALREAERVCALMRRLGDSFEAPLREQTAFAQGREMIRWWSQAGNADNDTANAQERPYSPDSADNARVRSPPSHPGRLFQQGRRREAANQPQDIRKPSGESHAKIRRQERRGLAPIGGSGP